MELMWTYYIYILHYLIGNYLEGNRNMSEILVVSSKSGIRRNVIYILPSGNKSSFS